MPKPATAISRDPFLRCLILGSPKVGKSSTVISTAPGMVYVINADGRDEALLGARRRSSNFEFDNVRSDSEMEQAVKIAKEGAKEGRYKTIVVDTLSSYAAALEAQCLRATENANGEADGRRAYPAYEKRLRHIIDSLFRAQAHVICISHYIELAGEVDENKQQKKFGNGIAPLLAGKARATVPMIFDDVIFMTMTKGERGERVFVCNPQGSWGPGSRSLETSETIPADITKLLEAMDAQAKKDASASKKNSTGASVKTSSVNGRAEARR
jgi:AAA domain